MGSSSERAVIRAKDNVLPAIVHIRPVKEVFSGGRREGMVVLGSGFIISSDGYVVTNEHVAGDSNLVRCVLSNREEVDAQVVGTDRYTDIAVLKIESERNNLPTVPFGKSSSLQTGQTVLALGSPHGLARSVSSGIVSVTDRYLGESGETISPYNTWIQTDAAINQGNSGGPLVNLRGEVVGVNTRKLGGADNIGFAIPVDIAREVVEEIIADGRVIRSWLGLMLQPMTSVTDDPKVQGVVIADVDPLSPAADAGIRPGDILVALNGAPVHARFEEALPAVEKAIADLPVGAEAQVRVRRAGEEVDIPATTIERSDMRGDEEELGEWAFTLAELTPEMVRRAQLPTRQGVYVSGVQVGGLAANAGLREGDIILTVDGVEVPSLSGFKEMYTQRVEQKTKLTMLTVKRGSLIRFVLVKQVAEGEEEAEADAADQAEVPATVPGDQLNEK